MWVPMVTHLTAPITKIMHLDLEGYAAGAILLYIVARQHRIRPIPNQESIQFVCIYPAVLNAASTCDKHAGRWQKSAVLIRTLSDRIGMG